MAPNHGGDPLGSILGPMGSHWVQKMGQNRENLPCPKIEFSTTPRPSIFLKKIEITVTAPNHGGDSLGSILGPIGSQWVKKWVKTVKNYHAPKFEFSTTPSHRFKKRNRIHGYATKSRLAPSRVHLGANGVPWGPKNGSKPKKITMPPNSNFWLPRGHQFFAKNGSYGYGAELQWWPPRVHLWSNGVPLGPKNGAKPWKFTMPQNSNFRLPRSHRFFTKNGSYSYGTKSRWGHSRVHVEANGFPLGPKMGSKRKKITMPQNSNFWLPRGHQFFAKNGSNGYGAELQWWPPRVHLWSNGVPLGPKNGAKPWKFTMPQNSNFRLPRGHRFFAKNGSYGYGAKSRWGPPRVHLGANGVPLVTKNGSKPWKFTMPQIRIFYHPAVIDFSKNIEVTVTAPNHGGDPLGSILGPIGSNWVKKGVKTVKNYHAPKFEFSTTPQSLIFWKKIEETVRTPNHGWDPLGSILGPMRSHWVQKMGQNHKKLPCPKIRTFDYPAVIRTSAKTKPKKVQKMTKK